MWLIGDGMTIRSSEGSIIVILPRHKDQFVAYDRLVNVLSEFCHQKQCMSGRSL